MLYKTDSCKYLFDNLKSGDFLGFYKKPWYYLFARIIWFITGNKLSHIAGVFDVRRRQGVVTFKLGEQIVSEGKIIKKYSIVKIDDNGYTIDSRFRQKHIDLYLLPNENKLSIAQNKTLREYWNKKEDYSFEELPFTINWIHKLFGDKNKIYDNNCSTACRQSMVEVGITDNKFDDLVPNPTEFAKFSYIGEIIKII
jgi:hypothetical protein